MIIDSVATTSRGCPNNTARDWEEKYYRELKNAVNYNISGNRLTIETTSDIK
ncbi:MAG: META domain-containing protein, partial [Bacteroidales bacterium]